MYRYSRLFTALLVAALVSLSPAPSRANEPGAAATAGLREALSNGATFGGTQNLTLMGTLGQPLVGAVVAGDDVLRQGFWLDQGLFVPLTCCRGIVGDAPADGDPVPSICDVSVLIDCVFVSRQPLVCNLEGDINQSGGPNPLQDDITIGDISILIDYLFITGSSLSLPECL